MPDVVLALAQEHRSGWGWCLTDGVSVRAGTVHSAAGSGYLLMSAIRAMVHTQASTGAQRGIVFELAEAAAHALHTLPIAVGYTLAKPRVNTFSIAAAGIDDGPLNSLAASARKITTITNININAIFGMFIKTVNDLLGIEFGTVDGADSDAVVRSGHRW